MRRSSGMRFVCRITRPSDDEEEEETDADEVRPFFAVTVAVLSSSATVLSGAEETAPGASS